MASPHKSIKIERVIPTVALNALHATSGLNPNETSVSKLTSSTAWNSCAPLKGSSTSTTPHIVSSPLWEEAFCQTNSVWKSEQNWSQNSVIRLWCWNNLPGSSICASSQVIASSSPVFEVWIAAFSHRSLGNPIVANCATIASSAAAPTWSVGPVKRNKTSAQDCSIIFCGTSKYLLQCHFQSLSNLIKCYTTEIHWLQLTSGADAIWSSGSCPQFKRRLRDDRKSPAVSGKSCSSGCSPWPRIELMSSSSGTSTKTSANTRQTPLKADTDVKEAKPQNKNLRLTRTFYQTDWSKVQY